ncbi:MAG: carboxymuconolactone decarboxylase family protein [Dehalococcoidia bacterium]
MPYVKTIPYSEAEGELKEAYDRVLQNQGRVGNVIAVNSLRPHLMKTLVPHIGSVMRTDSGLTPAERQMVATVVSSVNKCRY